MQSKQPRKPTYTPLISRPRTSPLLPSTAQRIELRKGSLLGFLTSLGHNRSLFLDREVWWLRVIVSTRGLGLIGLFDGGVRDCGGRVEICFGVI